MKNFIRTRPTADVAGAEYLAKAMAKWPAAIHERVPGRDSRTGLAKPTRRRSMSIRANAVLQLFR